MKDSVRLFFNSYEKKRNYFKTSHKKKVYKCLERQLNKLDIKDLEKLYRVLEILSYYRISFT